MSFEKQIMSKEKSHCILLKPNGGYCVYYPSNIFTQDYVLADILTKRLKRQSNSVSVQNVFSLFKMLGYIHLNNLLGMQPKGGYN